MDHSTLRVDYRQLTDDIRPLFRRLARSANESDDDAIQEAWARLLSKRYPPSDDAIIKQRLIVIGRNYLCNCKRKQQTHRRNQQGLSSLRPTFWTPDQTDNVLAELLSALEKLDPLERQIVDQRQHDTFGKIAENLGISESSVRRIHERALTHLRRLLCEG